jgi:hypothetical protein
VGTMDVSHCAAMGKGKRRPSSGSSRHEMRPCRRESCDRAGLRFGARLNTFLCSFV